MGKTVKFSNVFYDESDAWSRWTSHQKALRRTRIQQLANANLDDIDDIDDIENNSDSDDSDTFVTQHYLWKSQAPRKMRHR